MKGGTSDGLQPSEQVVTTVAEREDVDPTDLHKTLDTVVDPEALDDIFADRLDGKCRQSGRVVFEYYGYIVTVEAGGEISLEPVSEE